MTVAPAAPLTPPITETDQEDSRGHNTAPDEEGAHQDWIKQQTPWLQTAKVPCHDSSIQ